MNQYAHIELTNAITGSKKVIKVPRGRAFQVLGKFRNDIRYSSVRFVFA